MATSLTVVYLKDKPEFLAQVALCLFNEWGYAKKANSVQAIEKRLLKEANLATVPTVLVASFNNAFAGVARLCHNDCADRAELSPWLASVLVKAEFRGLGIGSCLVEEVSQLAQELGFEKLYLKTENKVEFYKKLGWTVLSKISYEGVPTTIMLKNLLP